ncbi:MAG TPA: hypothetical protein HPP77_08880 [Candidatus Hydrogenedentes bacterium]|nr:hypothetical protein [Candidatus Hydrogenedentota bacterium]HIJ74300.1 hypothetical protein [Candidatus Hydrogenedentota bacterium]
MKPWQKLEKLSISLTVVGFLGLGFCKVLQKALGMSEKQFLATPAGGPAIWTLSGAFLLGLFVLMPVCLCVRQRTEGGLPGPRLPDWLGWIVTIVAYVLLVIVLLVVAIGLGVYFFLQ